MAQAFSRQRLTEEPGFDPGADRMMIVVDKVAQEQGVSQSFFGVSLLTSFHQCSWFATMRALVFSRQVCDASGPGGRLIIFRLSGSFGEKLCSHFCLFWCIQSPVENSNILLSACGTVVESIKLQTAMLFNALKDIYTHNRTYCMVLWQGPGG